MYIDYLSRERTTTAKCPFGIYVDQAGYLPDSQKRAVMCFPCESFSVEDESGRVKFSGSTRHFGLDDTSGDDVYIADFSELSAPGRYRVTAGEQRSALFEIGWSAYDKTLRDISRSYYHLRCGCGLEEKYAGVFRHGRCHTSPAVLWEDRQTALDISGGWHDAGDYGRYVTAGSVAVAHLLYAYMLFPEVLGKLGLNIPESADGTMPDILSECKCELEWLMKMQREDGGVYHKATTQHHAAFVMPEDDKEQVYIFPVSSMAAADLAAVCALASRVYRPFDEEFAKRLRAAAEKSCEWLDDNEEFLGFANPENCETGSYAQREDKTNRFWAYAELYALTGDPRYHKRLEPPRDNYYLTSTLGYAETAGLGALAYLFCDKDTDDGLRAYCADAFHYEANRLKGIADSCGYGCAMESGHFYWGSNMVLLKHGMIFAISDVLSGTNRYREYAAAQLHYLLGLNATGYSFVTGSGEFCCRNPHYRPTFADGVDECLPGLVSGGPNRYLGDEDAPLLIPKGTPPMKCYADNVGCYSLNEVTIYWNSPAVFVIAFLMAGGRDGTRS